jgi:hypothetical protein
MTGEERDPGTGRQGIGRWGFGLVSSIGYMGFIEEMWGPEVFAPLSR